MAQFLHASRQAAQAIGACVAFVLVAASLAAGLGSALAQQQPNPNVRPPPGATIPGGPGASDATRPGNYDIEMWRKVRRGEKGYVSIPDAKAGRLVDSSGENWRHWRNESLPLYGAWLLGGMLALIALFYLLRGRIRIEDGWSGRTIERFGGIERTGHWLLATSFIILALTGLNMLYGRAVLMPVIGKEAFAALALAGKLLHNFVAFAFMAGLVWVLAAWLRHNLPHWRDLQWLAMGGGMLVKGVHPPSWKFNAGQKILFWLVILGGASISLSGLALLFPYQLPLFAKTFAALNGILGTGLPAVLTGNEEMHYASLWHGMMGIFLTAVIIGHIYIGTIGMQGAFSAMGSGQVDVNWAKQHHSLWAEEALKGGGESGISSPGTQPLPAE